MAAYCVRQNMGITPGSMPDMGQMQQMMSKMGMGM